MPYARGDWGTNLLPPFWALPLLAGALLEFRSILGSLAIFFLVYLSLATAYVGLVL